MYLTNPTIAQALVKARRERYEREAAQGRLLKAVRTPTAAEPLARAPASRTAGSPVTTPACCTAA
ncbi:MAG: hypothetical protein ACYC1C_14220 [Chloroflexota bacterium]